MVVHHGPPRTLRIEASHLIAVALVLHRTLVILFRFEVTDANKPTKEEFLDSLETDAMKYCGGSVCSDRFFGLLSGKIVQLVVVVAVGM